MSFISLKFAIVLAVALGLFHAAPGRWRPAILLAFSLAFYATWSVWHTGLLIAVTAAVYATALRLERTAVQNTKFRLVLLAMSAFLIVLSVFKFGQLAADAILTPVGGETSEVALLLLAPLGLSYYFFKLMGYLLDVYWEKIPAQRSFSALALYSSFFPQLICGPIQRADDFFEQLPAISRSDSRQFVQGLRRILFGLFKKVVVADQFGLLVAHVHGDPAAHSSLELLLGAYCFSLQLYADFSGITDIAIGIGLLFGIKGPENFDMPFLSRNIQEFWRRWHMSLTSWLADYLFLPLRMALRSLGGVGLAVALFINFLAVGVWHGPRWSYAVFGIFNGLLVVVSAFTLKKRNAFYKRHKQLAPWRAVGAPLLTFNLVVLTHILFQASDLTAALTYMRAMLEGLGSHTISPLRLDWQALGLSRLRFVFALLGIAAAEAVHWAGKQPAWVERYAAAPLPLRWGLSYGVALLVIVSARGTTSFIYAQF